MMGQFIRVLERLIRRAQPTTDVAGPTARNDAANAPLAVDIRITHAALEQVRGHVGFQQRRGSWLSDLLDEPD